MINEPCVDLQSVFAFFFCLPITIFDPKAAIVRFLPGETRFDMVIEPSPEVPQCSASLCIYAGDIWYPYVPASLCYSQPNND